jgi:predicted phosphate transport protein (TIGR00153 family)
VRFRLVPTDDKFFDLFLETAHNVRDCALMLQKMVENLDDAGKYRDSILACERKGDDLTRDVLARLHTSFVTPFDREDIHNLAERLDDVTDDMFHVADLLHLLKIETPMPEMTELCEVLVLMSAANVSLFERFESMKDLDSLLQELGQFESEGDRIYRRAIARLFAEHDTMTVLKWKDIFSATENALDRLEDVSDVVEAVVVKHA